MARRAERDDRSRSPTSRSADIEAAGLNYVSSSAGPIQPRIYGAVMRRNRLIVAAAICLALIIYATLRSWQEGPL
jgi:hypothetical protein